jgi:CO/xanthine dehydrogenase FAD-binding subunit
MKPAPFSYQRAHSVEDAVSALANCSGTAQALAGGQTLVPMPWCWWTWSWISAQSLR